MAEKNMLPDLGSVFKIHSMTVDKPIARHGHPFLELAYIENGWAEHSMDGSSARLRAGDYLIVDYGASHSYDIAGPGLTVINCLFVPGLIDASLTHCRSFQQMLTHYLIGLGHAAGRPPLAGHIFRDDSGEILAILKKLIREFENRRLGYLPIIRSSLIELILLTARKLPLFIPVTDDEAVCRLLDDVKNDPASDSLLSRRAVLSGLSASALSRRFEHASGMHFTEYLRSERLFQSCRLLSNTKLPVEKIAEMSGYSDRKHFGQIFKETFGMTPSAYRKVFFEQTS